MLTTLLQRVFCKKCSEPQKKKFQTFHISLLLPLYSSFLRKQHDEQKERDDDGFDEYNNTEEEKEELFRVDGVVLDLTNVRSRADRVSDRVCFARFRGFSFAVGDYESNRE